MILKKISLAAKPRSFIFFAPSKAELKFIKSAKENKEIAINFFIRDPFKVSWLQFRKQKLETKSSSSEEVFMIYVDADGCPVKDEIYKVAERCKVEVTLVANKQLNLPLNPLFKMVVVAGDFDAADDWIVENATAKDVVITADILLADRCIKKQARVLGPKGVEFTEDNIGTAVSNRELSQNLRHMGETGHGPSPMDKKARSQFLGKLDQILQAVRRL